MSNKQEKSLAIYTKDELSQVDNLKLTGSQVQQLLKRTPASRIYKRKGPKGKDGKHIYFDYVKGVYVKKVLNFLFGFEWSFEVVEYKFDTEAKQAYVLGKLTAPLADGSKVTKMQFGSSDIKTTAVGRYISIGNDLKAATTDALKKCAMELGLFSDVYQPDEYVEVQVLPEQEISLERVKELYEKHGDKLHPDDLLNVERIIDEKEENSYKKVIKTLYRHEQ